MISLIILVLLMSKWISLFLKKTHLLGCWDYFSCKLVCGSYIVPVAKTVSKNLYLKIFARKGGGKTKWRRVCQEMRKWLDCHIILKFLRRFFMMQHRKEILFCLSFLCLRGCAQNNCLNKIWDDWHCNSFNSVDGYNSCVHANNKHSGWYFLLLVW